MLNRLRQKLKRCLTSTGLNRAAGFLLLPGRLKDEADEIKNAKGILVLKPDGIGDVILVTGFLRSLRRQCPNAHIAIAVREASKELVAHACFCDEIVIWKEEWCGITLKPKSAVDLARSARAKWKSNQLDWVLIPRSGWDHANASMYAWWSGSTNVCAHEFFCNDRGLGRAGFVNHLIPTRGMIHETEFHRRMLEFLNLDSGIRPQLEIPAPAVEKTRELFAREKVRVKRVALGIGASHGSKRWKTENYKTLAAGLIQKWPDMTVFLIGGTDDRDVARAILAGSNGAIVDVTGKLSLSEAAALLDQCAVYVGNDSGPIHLAGAVGCAVVEITKHPITGNSVHECSPVRFGPIARWSQVLQPQPLAPECREGCDKPDAHCITNISVDQVLNTVSQAFTFVGYESRN